MATTTYPYSGGTYNVSTLSQEIVAGGITLHTVRGDTAAIEVVVDSATVEATLNAIVTAHTGAATPPHFYPALTGGTTTFVRADGTLADPIASRPPALAYGDASLPGGNTIASTTSTTPFTSGYTILADRLAVGSLVRITCRGVYSTDVAAPTLILAIKFGSLVVIGTAAVTMTDTLTNRGWKWEGDCVVKTAGSSGSMECHGMAVFATTSTTSVVVMAENTSTLSLNTTTTNAITVTAKWSASHASNSISLHAITVEILGTA